MATTTNFGWTTPDDTDLVKDGAAAIRTLGSAIDTSLVDLKGGTTGQVLSKTSNTDMDFTWVAPATLSFVGASVYKSATQSINNTTNTAITFDLENFDTDAFHSTVSNTSRFTIPVGKAGKYLVTGAAAFASNATGVRRWLFYKNGAAAMNVGAVSAASAGDTRLSCAWLADLAEGDYVEFFCYQSSGGSLNISGNATDVFFGIQFLGA